MGIETLLEREVTPIIMKSSLSLISKSHTLRCDAKQAERRFLELDEYFLKVEHFYLGDFIPNPLIKGTQPNYIEDPNEIGVPVISTIVIQGLRIRTEFCRFITDAEYEEISSEHKPTKGDVLLTMDGGTSIGKPTLFDLDDNYALDSHVAILRPVGVSPRLLVYLLASPLGQIQFQQAESGASGQTSVTEDDIRRFRFPKALKDKETQIVAEMDGHFDELGDLEEKIKLKTTEMWHGFMETFLEK